MKFVDVLLPEPRSARGVLPESESLAREHLLDFGDRGVADVLVTVEFRFAHANQVAKRADLHLLQAVSRPHREFEVGDRNVENRVVSRRGAILVIVVVHASRCLHVLEEKTGSRLVRIALDHLIEDVLGLGEVAGVLVDHREVDQCLELRGPGLSRGLVDLHRLLFLADEVEQVGETMKVLRLATMGDGFAVGDDRTEPVTRGLAVESLLEDRVGSRLVDRAASDDGVESFAHVLSAPLKSGPVERNPGFYSPRDRSSTSRTTPETPVLEEATTSSARSR